MAIKSTLFVTPKLRSNRKQLGQGMTEYIIIVALIAIAAITVFSLFGNVVQNQTSGIANELSGESATNSINKAKDSAGKAKSDASNVDDLSTYNNK